jgi:hypothetical protein
MTVDEMRDNLRAMGFNYSLLLEMTNGEVKQAFESTTFEELERTMDYYAEKYNY